MDSLLKKYGYAPDREKIDGEIARIAQNLESVKSEAVLKDCFSVMDLTSLRTNDTPESIGKLVRKVNDFSSAYPSWPLPASVCVYPNFAQICHDSLENENVKVVCVSGNFPSSQTFTEIKVAETAMAVHNGADEIDIVIPVGKFISGDYEGFSDEISELKEVCGGKKLKAILEVGALGSYTNIRKASILSMYAGADFIKTSTGKIGVSAFPEAAFVMCEAIRDYYNETGIRIGFKPAGGIRTVHDALVYYTIYKKILGEEWLNNDLFRIGASPAQDPVFPYDHRAHEYCHISVFQHSERAESESVGEGHRLTFGFRGSCGKREGEHRGYSRNGGSARQGNGSSVYNFVEAYVGNERKHRSANPTEGPEHTNVRKALGSAVRHGNGGGKAPSGHIGAHRYYEIHEYHHRREGEVGQKQKNRHCRIQNEENPLGVSHPVGKHSH